MSEPTTHQPPISEAALAPNLPEFLRWVDARPRTYADTMDAWRTSCPKLPAWEDAIDHGLILIDPVGAASQGQARVRLTARGRTVLRARAAPPAEVPVQPAARQLASLGFAQIMALMERAST